MTNQEIRSLVASIETREPATEFAKLFRVGNSRAKTIYKTMINQIVFMRNGYGYLVRGDKAIMLTPTEYAAYTMQGGIKI